MDLLRLHRGRRVGSQFGDRQAHTQQEPRGAEDGIGGAGEGEAGPEERAKVEEGEQADERASVGPQSRFGGGGEGESECDGDGGEGPGPGGRGIATCLRFGFISACFIVGKQVSLHS